MTLLKDLKSKFKEFSFIFALLIIIFLLLIPLFGKYTTYFTTQVLLYALFSLSTNLLLGYLGLLSFGQAAFYAIGAYGCGLILLAKPSLLLGIIGGTLLAGAIAFILGFLSVRHTNIYFAMLTLCFGMMVFWGAHKWRDVTGGEDGLRGIPRAPLEIPGLFSINMSPLEHYYYFVLIVSLTCIYILYRIVNSSFGLTLRGIRDSESRANFIGISVQNYRLLCFVIAGLFTGLAGSMVAPLEHIITPPYAHWTTSAMPVLACLLGGIDNFWGPVIGAFLLFTIKDLIVRYTEYWLILLGAVIITFVHICRGGVVGAIQGALRRLRSTRGSK